MIIVRLMGGLGNQLFQYAFGLNLSKIMRQEIYFDIGFYESQDKRSYMLNKLGINVNTAPVQECRYAGSPEFIINKLLVKLNLRKFFLPGLIIEQKLFSFEDFNNHRNHHNMFFWGYWQNLNYVDPILKILQKNFIQENYFALNKQREILPLSLDNACCVHVRRGDYANDPAIMQRHLTCDTNYYKTAIAKLKSAGIENFFFFSDDIHWSKDNFGHIENAYFMEGQRSEIEDFFTMVHFKNFVLSNSTFSWWAAKLCMEDDIKYVVYPEMWQANLKTADLNLSLGCEDKRFIF